MIDVEQRAAAIRKNMERLRALREAKQAEEALARPALGEVPKKQRKTALKISSVVARRRQKRGVQHAAETDCPSRR